MEQSMVPLDNFERRLAETVAWCNARVDAVDPQGCLRSAALRPSNFEARADRLFAYHTLEESVEVVAALADTRERLLRQRSVEVDSNNLALSGGKLLVSAPGESIWDSLSEHDSAGFFDEWDLPPWDTWVWLVGTPPADNFSYARVRLISWVPPALVVRAEDGINSNAVDCIAWAKGNPDPLLYQLCEAEHLG